MKCRDCDSDMKGESVFDNPHGDRKGRLTAWNLYSCEECGTIARENVWDNKGIVWVFPDNKTEISRQ